MVQNQSKSCLGANYFDSDILWHFSRKTATARATALRNVGSTWPGLYPFWLQRTEFGVKQWHNHGDTAQQCSAKHHCTHHRCSKKNPRESRYFSQSTDQSTCYRRELLGIHEKTKSLKTLSGPAVSCGCFPRRRISFLRIAGAIGDGLGTCFPSGNSLGQAVKSWVLDNPDGTVHWFLEIPMVPK